jgi:predicted dehydrogenase
MTDLVLIGAAHVHVPDHVRVARDQGARFVAVLDHDAARAAEWAGRLGARVVRDVADAGADAAIVASETARHEACAKLALDAGLPVLCEKPLAADVAAARRMATRAARAGCILDTAFSLRADPTVAELSGRLRAGALGRVLSARVRYAHDGALADWLDLSGWMTDPSEAGHGGFADEAVHALDWLMWTLGPVASGTARFGRSMGFAVDDHGVAALEMESGATATLEGGWTDRTIHFEAEVLGTDACAAIAMRADGGHGQITGRDGKVLFSAETRPLDAGAAVVPFLRAVRDGAPPLVDADHSASVVETLDRLYGRGT